MYAPNAPLHEALKNFRIQHKLSKKRVAEIMGVTERTYYSYETGERPVPTPAVIDLAVQTGADLNKMLLGRAAPEQYDETAQAVDDVFRIIDLLDERYDGMDERTKRKIARHAMSQDHILQARLYGEGMPDDEITDSVRVVTRYRFHPEDIPPPPWSDNCEADEYDERMENWQRDIQLGLLGLKNTEENWQMLQKIKKNERR